MIARITVIAAAWMLTTLACATTERAPVTLRHVEPAPAPASAPTPVATPAALAPPVARVEVVVDDYYGTKIADPYRWMEAPENPELEQWLLAQGAFAADHLAKIAGRAELLARIRELGFGIASVRRVQRAGDSTFYKKLEAGDVLAKLAVRLASGEERILVDPARIESSSGHHASVDNYAPSDDGRLVAYNLAEGGGEITAVHVIEAATGRELPDIVERIWGEFYVTWLPDGSGFFYTQLAPEGFSDPSVDKILNMQVYLHRLGTPANEDAHVFGRGVHANIPLDPEELPWIEPIRGSRWVMAVVGGARNESRIYVARLKDVLDGKPRWRKVSDYSDGVREAVIHGDEMFLLSLAGAPNYRVLRMPLSRPDLAKAKVAVPEDPEEVLMGIAAAQDALYVRTMRAGRARLLRLEYDAGEPVEIPLPAEGWIGSLDADPRRPGVTIELETWVTPAHFYTYDPEARRFIDTGLGVTSSADYRGIAVEEVEVTADDGTPIPLTILRPKDLVLDGSHPAILEGYGGYGSSWTPSFRPILLAWLERGGVYAIAHVRGGGEKGNDWHLAGKGPNKPTGIRDFIACAQHLVTAGYTRPARLAARGASMGGVLIGRAITERPDLFGAASIDVGIVNALRYLHGSNGANQKAELGTPDTEEGFRALLAMDVYHNVQDGVAYPAVIIPIGLNDARVSPWMSAKLAARLQVASTSGKPVLLRVEGDAGHGVGSSREQESALRADVWSFFLAQAGDPEFSAK